jgi:hypothetical protein
MQIGHIGGIGDFGKFALLRYLRQNRRLAVCWYLTDASNGMEDYGKHFDYLKQPDKFRHLAPELYDQLVDFAYDRRGIIDPLMALQSSGVLENAVFVGQEVPKRASMRPFWAKELASLVGGANLVFLDPGAGIQGKRLTKRHVALSEIAALRQNDRALVISHLQSGRKAEVKYLADRMKSLGCNSVEIVRLRLVKSCFYVILDQDTEMAELAATFVRKWGNLAKSYRF